MEILTQIKRKLSKPLIFPEVQTNIIKFEIFPDDIGLYGDYQQSEYFNTFKKILSICQDARMIVQGKPSRYFLIIPARFLNDVEKILGHIRHKVVDQVDSYDRFAEDVVSDNVAGFLGTKKTLMRHFYLIPKNDYIKLPSLNRKYLTSIYTFKKVLSKNTRLTAYSRIGVVTDYVSQIGKSKALKQAYELENNSNNLVDEDLFDVDVMLIIKAKTLKRLNKREVKLRQICTVNNIPLDNFFVNQYEALCYSRDFNRRMKAQVDFDLTLTDASMLTPFIFPRSISKTGIEVGVAQDAPFFIDDSESTVKHMIVTGTSRTGKTQFVKNYLSNILKNKDDNTSVMILDGAQKKVEDSYVYDYQSLVDEFGGKINHVKFDLERLSETTQKRLIQSIFDFKTHSSTNLGRHILVVDEAHIYADKPDILNLLTTIFRNGAKQDFQIIFITHAIHEFSKAQAKTIFGICSRFIHFKEREHAHKYLVKNNFLSSEEASYLSTCFVGDCLVKIYDKNNTENSITRVKIHEQF
jgi:hypothetical protein